LIRGVEKQYGALRPLRIRDLHVPAGQITMLIGFDRPSAEVFVNLITGATLPEKGEITSLGRQTGSIENSDEWLRFVEQFGIMSERIVLLDAMSIVQNLAISFDLNLEPVRAAVRERVAALAHDVEIDPSLMEIRLADAAPLLRARVNLGRALAFDPAVLVLEHPSANLAREDAAELASTVRNISRRRGLTTIGLLADQEFAKATGGRLLFWQPATGDVRERRLFNW
jgi:ABC-type transporter Mla maintaining outer membrane lipid asymmetry ATPase subunit MlaF